MKIVQSFWSKPLVRRNRLSAAGWPDKRSFLLGCALSALLLKRHYEHVELVTDAFGHELLVKKMGLPYEAPRVVLNALDGYCPSLWAIGKIFAYALQRERFVHVDFDFFMPGRLPDHLHGAPLLAFTTESGAPVREKVYAPPLREMAGFRELPASFGDNAGGPVLAYNAGIIGGSALDVFRNLKEVVFRIIDRNHAAIARRKNPAYNAVLEQYLFARLAQGAGLPVSCLADEKAVYNHQRFASMKYFPQTCVHLLGTVKRDKLNCLYLEDVLLQEFPEHYHRLCHLLAHHQL